jgi:hypothetical protein
MKTTHTIAGLLLVVVAIIAVSSATRSYQRAKVAQAAAAAETRRYDALRRQLDESKSNRAGSSRENPSAILEGSAAVSVRNESPGVANARPDSSQAKTVDSAPTARAQTQGEARRLSLDPIILTAIDPELRKLNVEIEEALVETAWGPLLAELKLSPERLEKFKTIRMALRQDSMEYEALADTRPLGMQDPEIKAQVGAGLKATEQQMRALFSPEEFQIYNAYYKGELYVSKTVENLAAELYFTEAPLSAQQGMRLMRMFAESSPRGTGGFGFIAGLNQGQLQTNIDAALAQMTTAEFSPLQIATLRKMRDQQQLQREIDQMLGTVAKRYPGVEKSNLSYASPSLPPRKS